MTTKTTLSQTCSSSYDITGATKFEITSGLSYIAPGDLPGARIFVFELGEVSDPKSDVFLRIGSIQDITQLSQGREAAVATSAATFLSSGFTVQYDDVATATAAKQLIQARIDQLIADWRMYSTAFANGEDIFFPLASDSIVQSKKNAYAAAEKAKKDADAVVAAAAAKFAQAQADAVAAAEKQTLYQSISAECATTKTALTTPVTALSTFLSSVDSVLALLNSLSEVTEGQFADKAAAVAAYNTTLVSSVRSYAATLSASKTTANTASYVPLVSLLGTVTSSCNSKAGEATTTALARAAADSVMTTAKRDVLVAQQTAATAQAAVEAALAEAVEACPTFDPATAG